MAVNEQAAQREAVQAVVGNGAVTPMGTCSARKAGGSMYGLYPSEVARADGVEQGTELVVWSHAPTNTVLLTPEQLVEQGHWADWALMR